MDSNASMKIEEWMLGGDRIHVTDEERAETHGNPEGRSLCDKDVMKSENG